MFQVDKIVHVRKTLESTGSQIGQGEWDAYFNWYVKAYRRFQDSEIASFKYSVQKAKECIETCALPYVK